jgi:hypothetical protein
VPNRIWFLSIHPPTSTSGIASAAPTRRHDTGRASSTTTSTSASQIGLNRLRVMAHSVSSADVASSHRRLGASR